MQYEGPRRQGRFIKQGSKVLEKISLVDFRFEEIKDSRVISLDNANRTIVHTQYHHPDELDKNIRHPERFDDDLTKPGQERPVIMPTDFTQEWERNKKLRKDRAQRIDDEEFDFELEMSQRFALEKLEAEKAASQAASQAANPGAAPTVAGQTPPAAAPAAGPGTKAAPAAAPVGTPNVAAAAPNERQKVDAAQHAIKIMREGGPPATPAAAPAAAAAVPAPPPATPAAKTPTAAAPDAPPAPRQASDDFISGVRDPEFEAARTYRQRLELEAQNKQQLEQLSEEAKARGYRDGFRAGEEKGETQTRQSAAQLFGKVSELIHEFMGLKHLILENVQENFYEISQAMAESLIKREFSIRPEAFVTVLRRAIAETVAPNKFKIRVHPETYDRVISLDEVGIKENLVKDPEVQPGDFKIESDLSVVDVNVSKMIGELLQQADLHLFDSEGGDGGEKAS